MKFIIVGSGIAGILLAECLKKYKPLLIGPKESSAPSTALVHPFPGRSIQPHPLQIEAVKAMSNQYNQWHKLFPKLCRPITMHRPLSGSGGERLLRSHQKHHHEYIDSPVSFQLQSHIPTDRDLKFKKSLAQQTLSYQPAFAIDAQKLITKRLETLKDHGCQHISDRLLRINGQEAITKSGQRYKFDHLFLAIGADWGSFFPDMSLTIEGGSLLHLPMLKHHHAFSINGIHFTPNFQQESVLGSTRWQGAAPQKSQCTNTLYNKASLLLDSVIPLSKANIWRGLRCLHTPDRLPVCGRIPNYSNISVLGALGNKGLLWGPVAAAQLSKSILNNRLISPFLSIDRVSGSLESPHIT